MTHPGSNWWVGSFRIFHAQREAFSFCGFVASCWGLALPHSCQPASVRRLWRDADCHFWGLKESACVPAPVLVVAVSSLLMGKSFLALSFYSLYNQKAGTIFLNVGQIAQGEIAAVTIIRQGEKDLSKEMMASGSMTAILALGQEEQHSFSWEGGLDLWWLPVVHLKVISSLRLTHVLLLHYMPASSEPHTRSHTHTHTLSISY